MNNKLNELFDLLNDDIMTIIYKYLSPEIKVWLNRKNYIKNHKCVKSLIDTKLYDSYVRDMVRNDYSFVLEQLIKENFRKWHNWKKYNYNGDIYKTYLVFIRNYANDNNSYKCLRLIDEYAENNGFSKNWFKQNRIIIHKTPQTWNN